MRKILSYDDIKNAFEQIGFELLSSKNEYHKTITKLALLDKEGYIYYTSYHKCIKLSREPLRFHASNPFTIYNIKRYLLLNKPNYKYVSGDFVKSTSKLTFKHTVCGNEFTTSWQCILNARSQDGGCSICFKNNLKTHEEFLQDLYNKNTHYQNGEFAVISTYKGDNKNVKFKCNTCGYEWETSATSILSHGSGCKECFYENNKGQNNSSWNPNLTEEERILKRSIDGDSHAIWRTKVFKRDCGTCQIIGKRYLPASTRNGQKWAINAHHLNGYHWDKENRYNVDNGVTLCKPIHDLFHKLYGKKNNTKEQFEDFLMRIDSGEFDNYLVYNLPLRIWINFRTI